MSDNQADLGSLFEIGTEAVVFGDSSDLREKVRFFLKHPDQRGAISQAARRRVLAQHTYRHRLRRILELLRSF